MFRLDDFQGVIVNSRCLTALRGQFWVESSIWSKPLKRLHMLKNLAELSMDFAVRR